MSMTNQHHAFSFVSKSIKDWADTHRASGHRTAELYCGLTELGSNNDCLEFLAWTLAKGMEHLRGLKGPLKVTNGLSTWRYGALVTQKYVHSPFSTTPLHSFFETVAPGVGNRRTVNILVANDHVNGKRFVGSGGPVFRFLFDGTCGDKLKFAMDTGPD